MESAHLLVEPGSPTKTCGRCLQPKDLEGDFYARTNSPDGRRSECKKCDGERAANWQAANPDQKRSNERRYYHDNPEKFKEKNMIRLYKVSLDEFKRMLAEQNGACAICGTTEPNGRGWQVDHDHRTGTVRALLCHSCNTGLGSLHDDVALLEKAIAYLKRFS